MPRRCLTTQRCHQVTLILAVLLGSWLGMQAIHEVGHVFGAWLTRGRVARVVLHPLTFSRTDLESNPAPLPVAWAGPLFGVAAPLMLWLIVAACRVSWAFVPRFFAGFCLLANGLYLAVGSLDRVGDAGDLLKQGAPAWHLWLFGAACTPLGLLLWHRQGTHFGFGTTPVSPRVAYGCLAVCAALLLLGILAGGDSPTWRV